MTNFYTKKKTFQPGCLLTYRYQKKRLGFFFFFLDHPHFSPGETETKKKWHLNIRKGAQSRPWFSWHLKSCSTLFNDWQHLCICVSSTKHLKPQAYLYLNILSINLPAGIRSKAKVHFCVRCSEEKRIGLKELKSLLCFYTF